MAHWIFGYGSLIWRPGFTFEHRQVGYIKGWSRRFYQGSEDHRGSPEAPGRVVTLIPEPETKCWGVAFAVAQQNLPEVIAYLDHREKNGFVKNQIDFYMPTVSEKRATTVYVANEKNPGFLGEASLDIIAGEIYSSTGPSGTNKEYLLELANGLRAEGIVDDHVFELERLVLAMQ